MRAILVKLPYPPQSLCIGKVHRHGLVESISVGRFRRSPIGAPQPLRNASPDIDVWTDRLFAALFVVQWHIEIAIAVWVSPRTWAGRENQIHPHVLTAVLLGGAVVVLPILLAE